MLTDDDNGNVMVVVVVVVMNKQWRGCRHGKLQPLAAVGTYSVKYSVLPSGLTVIPNE
jgi:hypothetical protein